MYEKRSKRVSSFENSTHKSSDKVEEVHIIFAYGVVFKMEADMIF